MKQLRNVNHSFDVPAGGIGVTIRKGNKWAGPALIGQEIELWECKEPHDGICTVETCDYHGKGQILGYWFGMLDELPPALLAMEHNEEARDFSKLMDMLERGYGSISFDDTVTALIYLRTEEWIPAEDNEQGVLGINLDGGTTVPAEKFVPGDELK